MLRNNRDDEEDADVEDLMKQVKEKSYKNKAGSTLERRKSIRQILGHEPQGLNPNMLRDNSDIMEEHNHMVMDQI